MQDRDLSHPLIAEILCRVHGLISDGTSVVFMLVPSHAGLAGNSAADSAAKADYISLARGRHLHSYFAKRHTCMPVTHCKVSSGL